MLWLCYSSDRTTRILIIIFFVLDDLEQGRNKLADCERLTKRNMRLRSDVVLCWMKEENILESKSACSSAWTKWSLITLSPSRLLAESEREEGGDQAKSRTSCLT